jgi:hypothetical protein
MACRVEYPTLESDGQHAEGTLGLLDRRVSQDRDRLVSEYASWMSNLNTRADLTLRCRASLRGPTGRRVALSLNDDLLRATIVRALNRLNGYVLAGRRTAASRPRLDGLVWTERGYIGGRPHIHALLERPGFVSPFAFAAMIEKAWQAQPFGYDEVLVEEVRDLERSIGYNAKASPNISGNLVYFHKEPQSSAWWRAEESL